MAPTHPIPKRGGGRRNGSFAAMPASQKFRWLIDSGSCFDLVGQQSLPHVNHQGVRDIDTPYMLETANDIIRAGQEADIHVFQFSQPAKVLLLPNSPSVLSLGRHCMEEGYGFHWEPFQHPRLVTPAGEDIELQVENLVPILVASKMGGGRPLQEQAAGDRCDSKDVPDTMPIATASVQSPLPP